MGDADEGEVRGSASVVELDDRGDHDAVSLDEHRGAEAQVSLIDAEHDLVVRPRHGVEYMFAAPFDADRAN